MKQFSLFVFLFVLWLGALCQNEELNISAMPFDIKSCKIVYRFVNGIQQGEKTVVFDDYGKVEKMTALSIVAGNGNESRIAGDTSYEMTIKKPGELYKVNLKEHTGFKTTRNETLPLNLESPRPGQVIIGPDTILDKPCTVVEIFGSLRTWYWNRIPIKKQVIGSGMTTKIEDVAISIEENYAVSSSEFEVPDGIKLK